MATQASLWPRGRPFPTEAGATLALWPRLPAARPGADLAAHGFLVLLVGGLQLGSGGADVDLRGRALCRCRGGRNGVLVIVEQVGH